MVRAYWFRILPTLMLALALTSCQQLFSTSIAVMLARSAPPDLASITADQAVSMLEEARANGDQVMAAALVAPLRAAAADTSSQSYSQVFTALVDAVIISTAIGPAITTGLADYAAGIAFDLDALLSSVAPTASTSAALLQIAAAVSNGHVPAAFTASQAYTASALLFVQIAREEGWSLETDVASFQAMATSGNAVYDAAVVLLEHGLAIDDGSSLLAQFDVTSQLQAFLAQ